MRSDIIQMLLNASSGKGGSDPVKPGQPSSDWTIVHFLTKQAEVEINGVSFKKKNQSEFFYICNLEIHNPITNNPKITL